MARRLLAVAIATIIPLATAIAGTPAKQDISPRGAFLRSLLLPGWGQKTLGSSHRASVYAVIEGTLWLGFGGLTALRSTYRDDYRGMATSMAGANIVGKESQYFSDLAFYDSSLEHNQLAVTRDGDELMLYPPSDGWQWSSSADRQVYRDRLNDWKRARQRMDYLLGVIALNHFISAVDAGKSAGRLRTNHRVGVVAVPVNGGGRIAVSWTVN